MIKTSKKDLEPTQLLSDLVVTKIKDFEDESHFKRQATVRRILVHFRYQSEVVELKHSVIKGNRKSIVTGKNVLYLTPAMVILLVLGKKLFSEKHFLADLDYLRI